MKKDLKIKISGLLICCLSLAGFSYAKRKTDYLSEALIKYQTNSGVQARVTKISTVKLLDQKITSTGGFIMGLKQLRMDFIKPDKQTLVINNNAVWLQTDTGDLGGGIQVSKTSLKKAYQSSNSLLAVLLGHEHFMSSMKTKSVKTEGSRVIYDLVPRRKMAANIQSTQIVINKDSREILELNYWDAAENQTSYVFTKTKFDKRFAQNRFDYKPPAGADVTEF